MQAEVGLRGTVIVDVVQIAEEDRVTPVIGPVIVDAAEIVDKVEERSLEAAEICSSLISIAFRFPAVEKPAGGPVGAGLLMTLEEEVVEGGGGRRSSGLGPGGAGEEGGGGWHRREIEGAPPPFREGGATAADAEEARKADAADICSSLISMGVPLPAVANPAGGPVGGGGIFTFEGTLKAGLKVLDDEEEDVVESRNADAKDSCEERSDKSEILLLQGLPRPYKQKYQRGSSTSRECALFALCFVTKCTSPAPR